MPWSPLALFFCPMIGESPDHPKCRAHSSQTGEPCKHWPMRGQRVCQTHGGRAPRAMLTAQERLAKMVDPALTQLSNLLELADSDAVKLAAIKDVLDRAGYKPREKVDQNVRQTIEVVYADSAARPIDNPALSAPAAPYPAEDHQ